MVTVFEMPAHELPCAFDLLQYVNKSNDVSKLLYYLYCTFTIFNFFTGFFFLNQSCYNFSSKNISSSIKQKIVYIKTWVTFYNKVPLVH